MVRMLASALLCTILLFVTNPLIAQEADTSMDVAVVPSGNGSVTVEWFPTYPGQSAAYQLNGYSQSDEALLLLETSTESTATLALPTSPEIVAIEVVSLASNGTVVERSPRESLVPVPEAMPKLMLDGPMLLNGSGQLSMSLVSCDSRNFPFVYLTVRVNEDGQPVDDLTKSNFAVTEDGRSQTVNFDVTPPQSGGGVRMADVVFLIDTSGSMGTEIAAVRNNCIAFANALVSSGIDYRLGLVEFGQSANSGNPRIIGGGLTSSAQTFQSWVSGLTATGGTEPGFAAIRLAIQNYSFRPGAQKVFILITDEDSDDRNKQSTINLILANNVTVHAAVLCSFGTSQADYCGTGSVRDVSGGLLFSVTGNYTTILSTIQENAANTYIVRYQTDTPALNGQTRQVLCTVSNTSSSASVQCSYVPGGAPMIERTPATIALHNTALVAGSSPTIAAYVTDAAAPFVQGVTLHVRKTGSTGGYTAVNMTAQGGNAYAASVPAVHVQSPGLDYYIRATDGQVTSSDPSTDPDSKPYQIAVLPNQMPVIEHTPPQWWVSGHDCPLTVRATDSTYHVRKIWIRYRTKGELIFQGVGREYAAGTTDITDTFTCLGEKCVEPAMQYYIEVTDDLGVTRRWPEGGADAPHELPIRSPLRGSVCVTTGWWLLSTEHPLPFVRVALIQQDGSYHKLTWADANGRFTFAPESPAELMPKGAYKLTAMLWYRPDWATDEIAHVRVMHDDADVLISSKEAFPIDMASASPQEIKIDFSDGNAYEALIADPDRADDLAMTFCYAAEFWSFVHANLTDALGNDLVIDWDLPLEIHSFADLGRDVAWYAGDDEIYMDWRTSSQGDDDQPMNLEWHESSHYLMDDTIGIPPRPVGDGNHGGNANSSTSDSWVEGYAEFWPCAVRRDKGDNDWRHYANFGSLEVQYTVWNLEEFAVAGLLIDLIDGIGENNEDPVQITVGELWDVIGNDAGLDDMKDVYDALVAAGIGQGDADSDGMVDLDEVFVAHGFFADRNAPGTTGYRVWNVGEEVGRSADTARPARRQQPRIPSAHLRVSATSGAGDPLLWGRVQITTRYQAPWQEYDSTEVRELVSSSGFDLYLHPSPSRFSPEVSVLVLAPDGRTSDTLKISMEEYRRTISRSDVPFVIAHSFAIGATCSTMVSDVFARELGEEADWSAAYLELAEGEQPSGVDLDEVLLVYANGSKCPTPISAANDPILPFVQTLETADVDSDGLKELLVKFPKPAVLAALADGSTGPQSITVRWTDSQGSAHEGTAFLGSVQDLTSRVERSIGVPRFDRRTGQYATAVTLRNTSGAPISGPMYLVVETITPSTVTLASSPDGTTADGKPYFNISTALGDGQLAPGETVVKEIQFNNPSRARFTFETSVLGVPMTE